MPTMPLSAESGGPPPLKPDIRARSRRSKGSSHPHPATDAAKPRETPSSSLATVTGLCRFRDTSRTPQAVCSIPSTPSLAAFKNDIVICHLLLKLSMSSPENFAHGDTTTISAVLYSPNTTTAAYTSGLSVAEAFFGRLYKIDDMLHHSAHLYGQALQKLREEMQDPSRSADRAYANLWGCLFLGIYEMVSNSSPESWLAHSRGISTLTQMAGPQSFQTQSARQMFEISRSFIAVGAIAQRSRSFLEQSVWKTTPWLLDSHTKSIGSMLQDVLCDIPGLMEDADSIKSAARQGQKSVHHQKDALRRKIQDIHHLANHLRLMWEEKNPLICWESEPNKETSLSLDDQGQALFPTVLHFLRQDLAREAMNFNVVRLLLHSISDTAGLSMAFTSQYLAGQTPTGPFPNPLLAPGQGSREDHALDICRTVDFLVLGEHGSHGALILMFPLRVAFGHLEGRPDVRLWLQGLFTNISTAKGFQIGEHVLQFSPATIKYSA
ncbi:hypothetical protein AK830_g7839 [Neonectria ditissima]|uniref:C6 zinc finger domain-containing protein n=1 Tax=Neonectria ditissima TaxID=78410 RepID=A0A0P7BDX8_9HYPO|nr:hypothetical protein AK830_g7839 [Neonectria ditissima]